MSIVIEKVETKKQLNQFIQFQIDLYKGNPNFVIPLKSFEKGTLDKTKNPAFDHCQAEYWIAKKDGKIVGRIAGIIHGAEIKENPVARFGWIDFTEDYEVFEALMNTAKNWAIENNLKGLHGPLGFTDLDFEGCLISGFDHLATQATIYNYPYYKDFFERYGFEKACDWVEIRGNIPTEMPRRLERSASIIANRFNLKAKKFRKNKELLKYAPGVFDVLNKAYSHLYGYYPLTEKQIDYYVDQYFGFVRREYVSIIVNEEDDVIGFALSLPSFSKALNKAKGSLFPFGFIHVLKALKGNDDMDLFLIGVDPEYQKLGANVLIFEQMFQAYIKNGVKTAATGPMLMDNHNVLNLWNEYDTNNDITRRCFIKMFENE